MILTRENLHSWLEIELGKDYQSFKNWVFYHFYPSTKAYIRILRKAEYHTNQNSVFHKLASKLYKYRLAWMSVRTGISIPINVCDSGLTIYHYGSIVINGTCKIGKNFCVSNNVNIGATGGSIKAPQIGNNVYVGPGAVIFGDIVIADNCYIGANAVVTRSILEPCSVVIGIPAKRIREDNVTWWEKNGLKRDK